MRRKYRSAVYTFSEQQANAAKAILYKLQPKFKNKLVTKVYPFSKFKPSREEIQNYYFKNPERPFCKRYINPKLKILIDKFSNHLKLEYA